MSGVYRLTVRGGFSASHQLRNCRSKCENLHGHNFSAAILVEGERLDPDMEILLDFSILKRELREALAELDHKHLNDIPPFDRINPSSENVARHLFQRLAPRVAAHGARLVEVEVGEKEGQSAAYRELDR